MFHAVQLFDQLIGRWAGWAGRRKMSEDPVRVCDGVRMPAELGQNHWSGRTVADRLIIRGAREHNLRDVSLDLPRDAMIVFTGLSGSGKSSLAFDTIFAEGQRRYVESLSSYARQFLGQMDK